MVVLDWNESIGMNLGFLIYVERYKNLEDLESTRLQKQSVQYT